MHLLYGLRRPTIGDRIESGELVKVLTEALPPPDDEVVDKVARNLDDLDTVRAELARLERTDAALTAFLRSYRGYLRGVLRRRVDQVRDALSELTRRRGAAGDAERRLASAAARRTRLPPRWTPWRVNAPPPAPTCGRCATAPPTARSTTCGSGVPPWMRWNQRRGPPGRPPEPPAAGSGPRRIVSRARPTTSAATSRRSALRCATPAASPGSAESTRCCSASHRPPSPSRSPPRNARCSPASTGPESEVARPAARALDPATGTGLSAWRDQLGEAELVVRARVRAAESLRARLAEVATREADARALGQEAERLDAQAARARGREQERAAELVQASREYAARVRGWADRLAAPNPPGGTDTEGTPVDAAAPHQAIDVAALRAAVDLPDDDELPVEARTLERDVPGRVGRTAHDAVDPVLTALDGARDEALAGERAVATDLASAREEQHRWEEQADPEPPRSRFATAARPSGTGAPLYLLVDFAATPAATPAGAPTDAERAGLEAALEACGLLDGWVCADGTVIAADTRDVLLRRGQPIGSAGRSLADVLRPAAAAGSGVGEATVAALLRSVGLGESEAASWVGVDGRWRLGVASGTYGKEVAEYVGAGVRAATRARRIAGLSARIDGLTAELTSAQASRQAVELRRDTLRRALRDLPACRVLAAAWAAYDQAVAEVARLLRERADARRTAE